MRAKFGWFAIPIKIGSESKNVYLKKADLSDDGDLKCIWVWGVELMALRSCLPESEVTISKYIQVKESGMLLRAAALLYEMRLEAKR